MSKYIIYASIAFLVLSQVSRADSGIQHFDKQLTQLKKICEKESGFELADGIERMLGVAAGLYGGLIVSLELSDNLGAKKLCVSYREKVETASFGELLRRQNEIFIYAKKCGRGAIKDEMLRKTISRSKAAANSSLNQYVKKCKSY